MRSSYDKEIKVSSMIMIMVGVEVEVEVGGGLLN